MSLRNARRNDKDVIKIIKDVYIKSFRIISYYVRDGIAQWV